VKALAWKAVPFLITAAVAVVAAVAIAGGRGDDGAAEPFEPPIPPVEFLYLDGERILKFLSAMEGGEVGPVKRISKEITAVNAGVAQGGFEVGASAQRESAAESTLTRTESSAFSLLLSSFEDRERESVRYHSRDLEEPADLENLSEGMLVRFVTHHLLSPGYIRPYVVVRQSATLAALFPQSGGNEADATKSQAQRRKAESFVRQVGPDPRLTFAVSPPSSDGEDPMKILLPMRYRGLTQERSLLEKGPDEYTGGRLIVIGKVIRLFRRSSGSPCEESRSCGSEAAVPYTDWATREIWKHPLEQASNYLINHVSRSCEMTLSAPERKEQAERGRPISLLRGRPCFLRKLEHQTELHAPGAVIVPIAIYK
jgi:hypothetical protein